MRRLILGLIASAAFVIAPNALGQNGRPAPIKLGKPAPGPSPTPTASTAPPIKIGKPAKTEAEVLAGLEEKKVIDTLLQQPLNPTTFQWAVGIGDVQMEPVSSHICLLTEVAGNFSGSEHVYLRINKNAPGGPRYILGGASKQAELKATATCARKDKFTPGMFSTGNIGYVELPVGIDTGCGPTQYGGVHPDTGAVFVREMAGKFRGGGEGVDMGISPGNGSIGLRTSACSGWAGGAVGGYLLGGGTGPDAKKGFGGVVKYAIPSGRVAQTSAATFTALQESGTGYPTWFGGGDEFRAAVPDKVLIPVNKGLCGIVMIRGKFQGFGEFVRIQQKNGNWIADVDTMANPGLVNAAFRCIARDQR